MKTLVLIAVLLFSSNYILAQKNKAESYFQEAIKYDELKQVDSAIYSINKAISLDSLNKRYLLHKINLLYKSKKCDEGLKILGILLSRESKDEILVSMYADLLNCTGKREEAAKVLSEYIKNNYSTSIILKLAQHLYVSGDFDQAISYYKTIVEQDKNNEAAIIDLYKIYYSLDRKDEAMLTLIKGLESNQESLALLINLSNFYYNEDEMNKCIEVMDKIIKIDYKPEYLKNRAVLFESINKSREAYSDYKSIITLDSCNLNSYLKILDYEFTNKLYSDVVKNSYAIIKCNNDYTSYVIQGLYISLFYLGEAKSAEYYLEKHLVSAPLDFTPYYIKALNLIEHKSYKEALSFIDEALKRKPDVEIQKQLYLMKVGILLITKDYKSLLKLVDEKDKVNIAQLPFKYDEEGKSKEVLLTVYYNRNIGKIETSLIIPRAVVKYLYDNYKISI